MRSAFAAANLSFRTISGVKRKFLEIFSGRQAVSKKFEIGKDAYAYEQALLKTYAAYRYHGPAVLSETGIDEIFTCDILGLDTVEKVDDLLLFSSA